MLKYCLFRICPWYPGAQFEEITRFVKFRRSSLHTNQTEDEDEALPRGRASLFSRQIAQRSLKQILDWEKALGQSSNRTLER